MLLEIELITFSPSRFDQRHAKVEDDATGVVGDLDTGAADLVGSSVDGDDH